MILFVRNKCFISVFLAILALLLLFSLSNVSAAVHNLNNSSTTSNLQNTINNDPGSDVIVNLAEGNYNFGQINISRNATIQGVNNNVKINGTGTLFNITAPNVKLINLTITGYSTAVISNSSGLTIANNDITTSSSSIVIGNSANDLKGIERKAKPFLQ